MQAGTKGKFNIFNVVPITGQKKNLKCKGCKYFPTL